MTADEMVRALAPLYDDIRKEESFSEVKPLLAHYTSLQVLEMILVNDEVWFSNPLYMNDYDELRFGMRRGFELISTSTEIRQACGAEDRHGHFLSAFKARFNQFDAEELVDTYIFCLSEHDRQDLDGVLSMWRGYGGNGSGAALVFDAGRFENLVESPLIIAKVKYGSEEERMTWLHGAVTTCAEVIRMNDLTVENLRHVAQAIFERLRVFALFTKHCGFAEEREWRVVYLRDRDPQNRMTKMFHYRSGPYGVEPILRFKVAPIEGLTSTDLSLDKIVERIILGPSRNSPMAKAGFLRMIDTLGKSFLVERIYGSSIPFRTIRAA